ncbi:MAG: bifunctional enoyl-CoA hydratase/phosphate acetyltransferase [Bacillota bacterium]|jgi:phosphate butyryltransferase
MVYKNFDELVSRVKDFPNAKRVAVAAAHDHHALEAVVKAAQEGIIEPVLVGDAAKIKEILAELGTTVDDTNIYDAPEFADSAALAVKLVKEGKADFLMKGKLDTGILLKAVVNKETGLGTGRIMTHFAIQKIPNYHKLLVTTDGGMMLYPTVEQKKDIIQNAVNTLISMGYDKPKVAVLAAVEKLNPKMQETVDGAELKEMWQKGEITDCIVEAPISYDIAMSKDVAKIKGFESPVAGDADILIVPNIAAGNILGKSLTISAQAKMAGFIVGAQVPIVLTSRGATSEEKYLSLVISAAAAN